ncbi:MAG: hypothetical protein CL512_03880 [Actinobacteria bacterium]|nr:hypothetical protein [Actinomycetota bacterium]
MKKFLGYGGVGDCFIIILKLLEQKEDFTYTHVESTLEKLQMCGELLNTYGIQHNLIHATNLRGWWLKNHNAYDKRFNLCAAGYINVPPRDFHWEPCKDEGVINPFNNHQTKQYNLLCAQVNGGLKNNHAQRHANKRPMAEYVKKIKKNLNVAWVGIDDFNPPFGESYSGKLSLKETMDMIAESKIFVGFNSILLYWALHNKVESHLFMDHQGKYDIRIHEEWKPYLHYIE